MMTAGKTRAQIFAELANPPERKWQQDPAGWAQERAGIALWSKQREIMEALRDHRKVAIASCHEIGKSFTAATAVCWWLDTHTPGTAKVVTTAPTAPQVKAILWSEINKIHKRAGLGGRTNLTEWYMSEQLVAFGRKPADHDENGFQGIHAEYMLVVLDEACGIPKRLWDAASTLVAGPEHRMLAIGNPDDPVGEFASVCAPGSGWHVIHVGYEDTPNFTGESVTPQVARSLISKEWVADREAYWGRESALFQSKCLGQFPTVGDPWQIIPISWANQCKYLEFPSGRKPVEAGIDIGAGNDRTVVTVREGPRVKAVEWFIDSDPMRSVGRVGAFLREHGVTCAKVDTIGVGWGIYGRLRELSTRNNPSGAEHTHDADVIPINVSEAPSPGKETQFMNKRAELWWDIGRENCRLAAWDFSGLPERYRNDLINELVMPKYEIMDSKGKIKVEAKEEIRKRLRGSPDLAESLLLAFVPASWSANTTGIGSLLSAPSLLQPTQWQPMGALSGRPW